MIGLPLLVFPDAFTRASPALIRSWIIARSNSANTPIIWKSALPPGVETELDVIEGMQFDRGYLSPYFITNADDMVAELEGLHPPPREEARWPSGHAALLEAVVQTGRPLLIVGKTSNVKHGSFWIAAGAAPPSDRAA
jgi:hypothetical protein